MSVDVEERSVDVIRHLAFEDLGYFEEVFDEHGYSLRYIDPVSEPIAHIADTTDPVVILGGPISVNDHDRFPFLDTEIALLKQRLSADLPTLGICLGAQIMARALGGRVYPGVTKEIGWSSLDLSVAGKDSPLAPLGDGVKVLHWHGDTFDLPESCELLASSELYAHQAFSSGIRCYGLQFHPEVTAEGLEHWYIGHVGEIDQTEGISVVSLRQQATENESELRACGEQFLLRWLDVVG